MTQKIIIPVNKELAKRITEMQEREAGFYMHTERRKGRNVLVIREWE